VNETILRFGYPETLVAQYRHWVVLLRPQQPTLGSLVLAAEGDFTSLSALPAEAFTELHRAVSDIEAALAEAVRYQKINYLMLMMVDPHVHWHVIPRYEGVREAEGLALADKGWPKLPQLADAEALDPSQIDALRDWLRRLWPSAR
jgi:diadenosine tetraphosphate (Ap4A) HIT family hydrolase